MDRKEVDSLDQHREPSAMARQSAGSSDQDALREAWNRARTRVSVVEDPGLEKVDFSALRNLIAAKTGNQKPVNYDPWELERRKAEDFNAEAQPPDGTGYDCKLCKNKEMIYEIKELPNGAPTHIIRPCKCIETKKAIRRMQRSGLEKIISDNLFPKYEAIEPWQKTVKDAAMQYAKDPKGWFFIGGQSGCGKTHLCTAICREELLRGRQVVYMMWRDDAPRLKAAVNSDEYPAMVDQYKNAPFLYIDDLFKVGKNNEAKVLPTSADINLAYEIINFRCVGKLPTIISSEFLLRELIDIDEATTGRIVQMAKGNSFNINPDRKKNYRLRGVIEL